MLQIFDNQPAHVYWNSGILIGAFLLCLLVGIIGALHHRFLAREKAHDLMYPGSAFPTLADVIFTVVFLAYSVFTLILPVNDSDGKENLFMSMLITIIYLALSYSPMIVRMLLLPHKKNIAMPTGANLPPLDQISSWTGIAGLGRDIFFAFITVFGTLVFSIFYEISGLPKLLSEVTGAPKNQWIVDTFIQGKPGLCILIAIAAVIIAPIGEECCFRGFLYNSLKKYSGQVIAMICSSLLFAAVHMSLNSILPLMVFAMLQCFIYQKSRSLRAPIIAHALFNSIELILIILFPDIV